MVKIIPLVLTCASLGAAHAASKFDPPDLSYEYQLHRQFLRQARPGGKVANVLGTEDYRLQKNETLKSLSEMLYGDGQYWPRVWSQNKANPHLVRPGHHLQFLLGSEDEAPAFRFSEDFDAADESSQSSGLERTAAAGNPIVDIPPPEVPPKPVLKVPPSFPEWQSVFKDMPKEILDDRDLGRVPDKIPDRFYLRAYVQEKPLAGSGEFMENDTEAGLPIVNQYVYVKMNKGTGSAGQRFLIVRDTGRVKRMHKQWSGDDEAYLIQIIAEVELRESVPAEFKKSKDRDSKDAFRALVTRTTGLSMKDCVLIPGTMQVLDMGVNGSHGSTSAQIIGSEASPASAVFGAGSLVFLNKGTGQGVEVGQLYDIFADRTTRRTDAIVKYSPAASGTIKIVRASDRLATAVVLQARDSVQQGDITREVSGRIQKAEELDIIPSDGPSAADDQMEESLGDSSVDGDESDLENEIESGESF